MKTDSLEEILSESTLSSSGWRRIFHTRKPLNPNSTSTSLDKGITYFLHIAFEVIGDYFNNTFSAKKLQPVIVIARDSRPTGAKASAILKSTLAKKKILFLDLGVTSIPECVAITKTKSIDGFSFKGFIYLTASHNPPGYNGIKIGTSSGRIISSHVNATLIRHFKRVFLNERHISKTNLEGHNSHKSTQELGYEIDKAKLKNYYHESILHTLGKGRPGSGKSYHELIRAIKSNNYAIGCDFNGSARINSIDKDFFTSLGFEFLAIGTKLGKFDHDIVPEGKSLLSLQKAVQRWSKKPILFGYTVDCDGDRGNLVIQVPPKAEVITPDAQTTFAFSVLAELCYTAVFTPKLLKKTALVVNGPTSLRIDSLAKAFKVKVFRAEVGEINVVTLANKIKQQGYHVPILGEGSNGGSIIPPSTIRDPLGTAASIIKLLFLKHKNISLRDIAVEKLTAPKGLLSLPPQYFLGALLPYLNTFTSTSVFESNALLSTNYSSQKNFKQIYSELFIQYWNRHSATFKKMGINSYGFVLYEQTETIASGKKINLVKEAHQVFTGGFKVSFYSRTKKELGFVWFRFSKTEPVLRLSAEHQIPKHQQDLFNLHRRLLKETAKVDKQKNH